MPRERIVGAGTRSHARGEESGNCFAQSRWAWMLLHLPNGQWKKTRESFELPNAMPIVGLQMDVEIFRTQATCDSVVDSTET